MLRATPNRWVILGIGLAAQTVSCAFLYGLPMLLPRLRADSHLSLAAAGWVVAAPTVGLLATLVAWGIVTDRRGERGVMAIGLAGAGLFVIGAAVVPQLGGRIVLLALAGASGASVNVASGRVVLGWFAPHERGTAMGARQTAQPLGVGLAALLLPPVADAGGVRLALLVLAGLLLVTCVLVAALVVDPPRESVRQVAPRGTPYRTSALWRVHGASALLVIPQFAISAFALDYLVTDRHWGATSAGRLLFGYQICGAIGRVAVGRWSDHRRSRLGPMRLVAVAAVVVMLALGLGAGASPGLAVVAIGLGAVVTVADNGLAFTAVAELAGSAWAGRAMGVQNTGQNIVASLTPPLLGGLIAAAGFGVGFAVTAVFPLLAIVATPVAAETARWQAMSDATIRS